MTFGELLIKALERSVANGQRWVTADWLLDTVEKISQDPDMSEWERVVVADYVRHVREKKQ